MEFNEDQIKTYVPIHELDELTANYPNVVDLKNDDLFLVSQVSAYSTSTTNAVTVSKKINYGNLSKKLCLDFGILSIADLTNSVDYLSSTLQSVSTSLDNEIVLCASTLSNRIDDLQNDIDNSFVRKYDGTYSLLTYDTETSSYRIAQSFNVDEGQIQQIDYDSTIAISDVFALDLNGKVVAGGIIDGSMYGDSQELTSDGSQLAYTIGDNDCYLAIELSVIEVDSLSSTLGLYIQTSDESYVNVYQFNNPGGLPGQAYVNYYSALLPIARGKTVVVKYSDGSGVAYGSRMCVKQFKITATLAQTELSNYVHKVNVIEDASDKALYKIAIDAQGLVTQAEKYDLNAATSTSLGLVKLSETNDTHYGLTADSGGSAYVVVPKASSSSFGTVKVNGESTGQKYAVSTDYDGMAYVQLNMSDNIRAGIVKTAAAPTSIVGEEKEVHLNDNGVACVQIPKFMAEKPIEAYDIDTPIWLSNGVAMASFLSSTVHFSPRQISALNADDYVLVNATTTSISAKIKYRNLLGSMMKVLAPSQGSSRQQVISCGVQNDSQYQMCSATIDESGLYQFEVFADGNGQSSSRSTSSCFCSIKVNGIIVDSADSAYWHKCLWLSKEDQISLEAFTSTNIYDKASGYRAIYKVS